MFELYYVYMPHINKALDEVSNDWKYHPLSSARNRLPYELSPYGMARLVHLDSTFPQFAEGRYWSEYSKSILQSNIEILKSRLTLCSRHL